MKKFIIHYKFKILFIIAAAIAIAIIFALFSVDGSTNSQNLSFINSFGWKTEDAPEDISHITMPDEIVGAYDIHSKISAANGTALSDYKGSNITRYSYKVLNHKSSDSGRVRANIFVYKSSIVAADISDLSAGGTTVPISDTTDMAPDSTTN